MAKPTIFTLGTSEKVYVYRDKVRDSDMPDGIAEETALAVTFELEPGEDLEEVVKAKAAEIGEIHAEVQKTIRLSRAERKAMTTTTRATTGAGPAFQPANTGPQYTGASTEPQTNGSEPPLTVPQRLSIEEHFRRLRYSEQEASALINGRFGKSRLTLLSKRQASILLGELKGMSVDPARINQPAQPVCSPVHGRTRTAKRNIR